ncbi:MAG TPA: DUF805 domain-containing protein [Polyangiaceae bacterium]
MLSLDVPIARPRFLLWAVVLTALKIGLDALFSRVFHQPFSLLFYVSPLLGPLTILPSGQGWAGAPHAASAYFLVLVGTALPFIMVGVALTIRRLRDAGLPAGLALFFFVPFVKFLFFAVLAAMPTRNGRRQVAVDEAGPFRSAEVDLGPVASVRDPRKRRALAFLLGTLAGDGVALTAMGVSVGLLGDYGAPLMIATPAVAGFVATFVYARVHRASAGGAFLVTFFTFVLGVVALALSAIEGFGCLFMFAPLFFVEALVGSFLAYTFTRTLREAPLAPLVSGMFVLPATFLANGAQPAANEGSRMVESEVIVHAPPDAVWKRVVSFPPLPPPTEAIFKTGIAAPLAATIDGEGVGAVRRCEFTTGAFVEPINVWEPGHRLGFAVTSQPDPMREWTLYPGPRPPHLDGYLRSTRGEFLLDPQPDGSTRLVGRTWYQVKMAPEGYWRFWSDRIIHAIHLRVLKHVAGLAEGDVAHLTPA